MNRNLSSQFPPDVHQHEEGPVTVRYVGEDPANRHTPESAGWHSVHAYLDEGKPWEQHVGVMHWRKKAAGGIRGQVDWIESGMPGVGTHMWEHAQKLPVTPKPAHSADRTDAGDEWARKVGGKLPRRKK